LKKPLLCDYLSDDDPERQATIKSKPSPSKVEEEKGAPDRGSLTKSPTKVEEFFETEEIKESWFRRLWNTVIRRKIKDKFTEEEKKQR
jgi:hypothetical protein